MSAEFVERRNSSTTTGSKLERRQFGNSYAGLSPAARELGEAVDRYKLVNRRRYITYEEMLQVMQELGYAKN